MPPVAEVVLDIKSAFNRRLYSYTIPDELRNEVAIGSTVVVPARNRARIGYVVEIKEGGPEIAEGPVKTVELKPVLQVVTDAPLISTEQLAVSRWISEYYLCGLNDCLKLVLPTGLRHHLISWVVYNGQVEIEPNSQDDRALTWLQKQGGRVKTPEFNRAFGRAALERLEAVGAVIKKYELIDPADKPKMIEYAAAAAEEAPARGPKQKAVMEDLLVNGPAAVKELADRHKTGRATIKSLADKGLITLCKKIEEREYDTSFTNPAVKKISLNEDQKTAVKAINEAIAGRARKSFLLEGVTGSGKTEVYMRAAAECLKSGRSAIFLVPEIALMPQLAERLSERFGKSQIAVIHSAVKSGERADAVRSVARGRKRIVVGARSALFAPVRDLGLIVIDEEHESSYKQGSVPRYEARAVAEKMAGLYGAVVVFGSATPSLETLSRITKEGGLLVLKARAGELKTPKKKLVDMRREVGRGNYGIFSRYLLKRLAETVDSGNKAILLINRRGFANFTQCLSCGFVFECRRCSVSMTYHRNTNRMICHHCGSVRIMPSSCPECAGDKWRHSGVGTQRVESELRELLPDLSVVRMDADSTGANRAHHDKLLQFLTSDRAVLLGTQMVAKGLDFPEVALVGIINADTAINLPDFRAAERTAQLLIQVSGRSGRGAVPGEVIVQTFSPDNYAVRAVTGGYGAFYDREMEFRRQLDYPPFSSMINIIFSSRDRTVAENESKRISAHLKKKADRWARFLGPAPAPIERVKGYWRRHLILITRDPDALKNILSHDEVMAKGAAKLRLIVDVDPVSLL